MPGAFEELRAEMVLDADGVSSGVSSAESSLSGLRKSIGLTGAAAGAAAAGGLAASVKAASDFESQMTELEKVAGAETAREMGDAIQDMAGEMALSQGKLAGVAEQAGRLGIEGTDNIREFTQVVGEMSVATDLTADQAADSFARMTTLMDEPVSNVRTLGDSVNELSNTMATSSSEITNAVKRSAGSLTNMGMASEDILALNASMNEVSESSERAGTRLRRMSQELMSPKKVGDLSSALGMTADEFKNMRSNDPTGLIQRMAREMSEGGETADALRGTLSTTSRQALAGLSNNLDGMNSALETSSQQFKEGGSLTSEFETAMGTFKSQVQLAKNTLTNIGITIGNVLLPHLTTLMKYVTGALQRFQDFNKATNGVAATVGLIGTAVGGLSVALAAFWPMISSAVVPALSTLGTVLAGLSAPFLATAAAVVALAAVFSGRLPEILSTVDRVFGQLPGKIQQGVNTALTWLRSTGVPMARQAFQTMFRRGVEAVALLREWLPPRVRGAVQAGLAWLRSTGVPLAVQGFRELATRAVAGLEILAARLPPLISRAVTAGTKWLLTTGAPMAMTAFGRLVDLATTALERLMVVLPPVVNRAVRALVAWVRSTGIPLFRSAIGTFIDTAIQVFGLLRQHLPPLISRAVNGIVTWIRSRGLPLMRQAFGLYITAVTTVLGTLREHLPPLVRQAVTAMVSWLRENGPPLIRTAIGLLVDAARTAFGLIKQYLPPLVRQGVTAVATWIRENGPGLIKKAFKLIGTAIRTVVLGIFGSEGSLRSLVSDGIGFVVTYLREDAPGDLKTAAGIALDALVLGAKTALEALTPPDGIIVQIISDIVTYLLEEGPGLLKAAAEFAFDAIIAAAEGLYEGLIGNSLFPEMFQDIISYIKNVDVQGAMHDILNDAYLWIKNTAIPDFLSAGEGLVDAMVDGIKDSPGAIKNAVEDIVGNARDMLPWSDAKEGPFSDLTGSGAAIPETIAKGARKNLGALTDVLGEVPSPGPDSRPSPGSTATPATTGASSGGDNVEIHFDFGDLDDDAYISVRALKQMIEAEREAEDRQERKSRKAGPRGR